MLHPNITNKLHPKEDIALTIISEMISEVVAKKAVLARAPAVINMIGNRK